MKAAVLNQYGVPSYGDFDEPSPQNGHSLVAVRAAPVNAIDVAMASGRHPFSPKVLPVVAGIEGVGVTQGRRVYFFGSAPPYGSMAQTTLVPDTNMFDVPDGLDDARAASRVLAPRGRLIQLGDRAGHDMTVALAPLRAVGASIIGFTPAHYGLDAMRSAYATLTQLTLEGTLIVETTKAPLRAVEDVWRAHGNARSKVVLSIDAGDLAGDDDE